jgi:hypothetical protein
MHRQICHDLFYINVNHGTNCSSENSSRRKKNFDRDDFQRKFI